MNVRLDLSRIEGLQEVQSAGLPAIITALVQEIESEVAHIEAALTDDDLASAATAAHAANNSRPELGAVALGSPNSEVTADQEAFIVAVAAQLGQSLARVNALYELSRSQQRTIERLTRAVEFRDEETANHIKRVSRYCALLATLSGVDEQRAELIATSSMMHDVGKLGIPDRILR